MENLIVRNVISEKLILHHNIRFINSLCAFYSSHLSISITGIVFLTSYGFHIFGLVLVDQNFRHLPGVSVKRQVPIPRRFIGKVGGELTMGLDLVQGFKLSIAELKQ